MAIYEEEKPSRGRALLFLTLAFLAVYCPWRLGDLELRWLEGNYAAMSLDICGCPPVNLAYGRLMPGAYPLYPMVVSWLRLLTGMSMEYALRLVSVVSVAVLGVMVWEAARQAAGRLAAAAAAAALISSLVVMDKGLDGYPAMPALVFVFAAWLAWFHHGAGRNDWDAAWTYSLLFAGLAFYTDGWRCLLIFIFPLLFMRRPLTIWGKMARTKTPGPADDDGTGGVLAGGRRTATRFGLVFGLALLAFFILLWAAPRWFFPGPPGPAAWGDADKLAAWGWHLLSFPFDACLRFIPWILLAWAPFCVAFHDLDRTPLFSKYLRTITISLFFLFWLNPFTESRDMVFLAPPLAVMIGLNYWLLARRHGRAVKRLLGYAAHAFAILAAAALLFHLGRLLAPGLFHRAVAEVLAIAAIEGVDADSAAWVAANYGVFGLYAAMAGVMIGVAALSFWDDLRVYECVLAVVACAAMGYWSVVYPFRVADKRLPDSKWRQGQDFHRALDAAGMADDDIIYIDPGIQGFYIRGYYLGCGEDGRHLGWRICELDAFSELPAKRSKVFLISLEAPGFPERLWSAIASMPYRGHNIYLWEGTVAGPERPVADDW
jgi:hypothetical protein